MVPQANIETCTGHAPYRILIIEDNPIFMVQIVEAASKITKSEDILSVSSGAEYNKIIYPLSKTIDIALVDLGLPDISGIDIIKDLKSRSPDTIILVISVIAKQESVIEAIRAGARGYILKGESQTVIRKAILDVMEGNYPISPAIARYLFSLAEATKPLSSPPIELTNREKETLNHIASGLTYAETAQAMKVSLSTIQTNIRRLYKKLGASSQVQAVNRARSYGLIHSERQ